MKRKRMKQLKKIITQVMLCTACSRNVDRLYSIWFYDSDNIKLRSEKRCLKNWN